MADTNVEPAPGRREGPGEGHGGSAGLARRVGWRRWVALLVVVVLLVALGAAYVV